MSLIKDLASRMRDPERVKTTVLDPKNRHPHPSKFTHSWSDLALGGGYPGALLLLAELDQQFPSEKWDEAVHAYVLKIRESILSDGIQEFSLYGGLAGLLFALKRSSRNGTRYQKLIKSLDDYLIKNVKDVYFPLLRENLTKKQPSPMPSYDLIGGVTGIAVYCLQQLDEPQFFDVLQEILSILISLVKSIEVDKRQVPGWYTPPSLMFLDEEKTNYPKGNFNMGLAHGIPGILALLSVSSLYGLEVPEQKETIAQLANWIKNQRVECSAGFFWETAIPFERIFSRPNEKRIFSGRDAWCYGTPGVASSLFLAGKAMNDAALKNFSLDSFRDVFKRSVLERRLPGPTFCHGVSGLLLITHQFAKEMQASDLAEHVDLLTEELLQFYQPLSPFGFKNLEPSQGGTLLEIDRADLLEGSSGILLTLLSVCGSTSWWHAPFLISDGK